ncbi:S-arrestin-like [Cololabis saira]|uniref:S-arrestin-like n=1 Tax=Cololabis saira TaxID=129043 RepID=UPI002AD42994|nr:S-arrestin-like [Cololabis saira]
MKLQPAVRSEHKVAVQSEFILVFILTTSCSSRDITTGLSGLCHAVMSERNHRAAISPDEVIGRPTCSTSAALRGAAGHRSSVRLTIRKIQFSPDKSDVVPNADMTFQFLMSEKPLQVKLSLPKEIFYHGEPLKANVEITNSSSRSIKNINLSVDQVTNVALYSNDKYVKSVARDDTDDVVPSGTSLKKQFTLHPLLSLNKDRRGIALDGRLKHEDTNLASSSMVNQEVLREVQGMLISYKVVLKMTASGTVGSSEVSMEVPFKLMHPKPEPAKESEDMVFEEFKRAYLKGIVYGDDDESPTEA